MGGKQSTLQMYESRLTRDELDHLSELFKKVSSDSSGKGCTYDDFLSFCGVLHPLLTQFVVEFYFGNNWNSAIQSVREFISFYVNLIRGSMEDRAKVMEVMLFRIKSESPSSAGVTGSSYDNDLSTLPIDFSIEERTFKTKIGNYLRGLICSYIKLEYNRHLEEFWSWRKVKSSFIPADVDRFADALQNNVSVFESTEDTDKWIIEWRTIRLLHYTVYSHLFRFEELTLEPIKTLYPLCVVKHSHTKCLIDMCSVLHINCFLPKKCRYQWTRLFTSAVHGTNFRHMMNKIENEGPTLVVIKDKNGYVFGGFASESWCTSESSYGTSASFVFQASPNLAIYESSGLNEDYQYVSAIHHPKGLGMGKGTMGLLAWWIEPERQKGSCALQCNTFHNLPLLASRQVFQIENFEVWGLDVKKKKKRRFSPVKFHTYASSEKDSNIRDASKSLYAHTGKSAYSDGYRSAAAASKWNDNQEDDRQDDDDEADAAQRDETNEDNGDDDEYDDIDDEDDDDEKINNDASRVSHSSSNIQSRDSHGSQSARKHKKIIIKN